MIREKSRLAISFNFESISKVSWRISEWLLDYSRASIAPITACDLGVRLVHGGTYLRRSTLGYEAQIGDGSREPEKSAWAT